MTIKQASELHLEEEGHPWTLESPEAVLMKIGNQDVVMILSP